jgi:hypothetical protein
MRACVAQSGFSGYVRKFASPNAERSCIERNRRALEFFAQYRPSHVILSNAKRGTPASIAKPTQFILGELRRSGHSAFAMGDFIRPGVNMMVCRRVPAWLFTDEQLKSRCAADARTASVEIAYNRKLAQYLGSDFVDIVDVQCPLGKCIYETERGPLFRDTHHLTSEGAILFVGRLRPSLPIGNTVPLAAVRGDRPVQVGAQPLDK